MHQVVAGCAYVFAAPFALLTLVAWLDGIGLVHRSLPFYGFDYMPQGLASVFMALPAVALLAVNRPRVAAGLAGAALFFLAWRGDYSFAFLRSRPTADDEIRFTVATLNVEWFRRGFPVIVSGIRQVDADVILINENTLPAEAGEVFAAELPEYHYATGRPGETAILSKFPIVEAKEVDLPTRQACVSGPNRIEDMPDKPHRSFVHAVLDVDGVHVNAISFRFSAGRPPGKSMLDQFRWGRYVLKSHMEDVDFFTEYLKSLEGPVFFGGDMNATPPSKTIRRIRRIANDAFLANNFRGRPTFRVPRDRVRLDFIFKRGPIRSVHSEVLRVAVSDHYWVFSEMAVARPAD